MYLTWSNWARGEMGTYHTGLNCPRIQCDHGLVIPNDKNHPVCAFMDDYFINGMRKGMANAPNLRDTFEKHTQVWNNYRHRKMAASILIRMSTNLLLSNDVDTWLPNAFTILVLEYYDPTREINATIRGCDVATKYRDISQGGKPSIRRDLLKFYRKRTTCSCLKHMHLVARETLRKMGQCSHCGVTKERALLMVCGRCRVEQYCSRECQAANWPDAFCNF